MADLKKLTDSVLSIFGEPLQDRPSPYWKAQRDEGRALVGARPRVLTCASGGGQGGEALGGIAQLGGRRVERAHVEVIDARRARSWRLPHGEVANSVRSEALAGTLKCAAGTVGRMVVAGGSGRGWEPASGALQHPPRREDLVLGQPAKLGPPPHNVARIKVSGSGDGRAQPIEPRRCARVHGRIHNAPSQLVRSFRRWGWSQL